VTQRLARRLLRHHLPLGLCSAAAVWLLYTSRSYSDVLTRLSFSTAWPALVLLTLTLLIGPWRTLRGKMPAVSLDLRRDAGIWAGTLGLLHTGVGQCVHLRGRPWLYYVYEKWREHPVPLRHDIFGFSNFTGLFAALILLTALATSNDASLRAMGSASWKSLQRWNYACFALATIHTFGYLLGIESLKPLFIITAILCVIVAGFLQGAGYRRYARFPAQTVRNGTKSLFKIFLSRNHGREP
jgi:sulfoxide reductase heme-binding subunit YedZ